MLLCVSTSLVTSAALVSHSHLQGEGPTLKTIDPNVENLPPHLSWLMAKFNTDLELKSSLFHMEWEGGQRKHLCPQRTPHLDPSSATSVQDLSWEQLREDGILGDVLEGGQQDMVKLLSSAGMWQEDDEAEYARINAVKNVGTEEEMYADVKAEGLLEAVSLGTDSTDGPSLEWKRSVFNSIVSQKPVVVMRSFQEENFDGYLAPFLFFCNPDHQDKRSEHVFGLLIQPYMWRHRDRRTISSSESWVWYGAFNVSGKQGISTFQGVMVNRKEPQALSVIHYNSMLNIDQPIKLIKDERGLPEMNFQWDTKQIAARSFIDTKDSNLENYMEFGDGSNLQVLTKVSRRAKVPVFRDMLWKNDNGDIFEQQGKLIGGDLANVEDGYTRTQQEWYFQTNSKTSANHRSVRDGAVMDAMPKLLADGIFTKKAFDKKYPSGYDSNDFFHNKLTWDMVEGSGYCSGNANARCGDYKDYKSCRAGGQCEWYVKNFFINIQAARMCHAANVQNEEDYLVLRKRMEGKGLVWADQQYIYDHVKGFLQPYLELEKWKTGDLVTVRHFNDFPVDIQGSVHEPSIVSKLVKVIEDKGEKVRVSVSVGMQPVWEGDVAKQSLQSKGFRDLEKTLHDKRKCLRNESFDLGCCAPREQIGCAEGYKVEIAEPCGTQISFAGLRTRSDKIPGSRWWSFECKPTKLATSVRNLETAKSLTMPRRESISKPVPVYGSADPNPWNEVGYLDYSSTVQVLHTRVFTPMATSLRKTQNRHILAQIKLGDVKILQDADTQTRLEPGRIPEALWVNVADIHFNKEDGGLVVPHVEVVQV